jgi:hypothetical protein
MEMIDDEPDLSIYDFNSIINYIKNNFIQILLLLLVFFIIYLVDQISNINTMIMAPISMIPGIPQQPKNPPIKMPKGRKMSKK